MQVPRPIMYLMISGAWCTNYLVRNSLPSLLPFIARAQGFTDTQLATLLVRTIDATAAADPDRRRFLKAIKHSAALRMVERAQAAGDSTASTALVAELAEMIR